MCSYLNKFISHNLCICITAKISVYQKLFHKQKKIPIANFTALRHHPDCLLWYFPSLLYHSTNFWTTVISLKMHYIVKQRRHCNLVLPFPTMVIFPIICLTGIMMSITNKFKNSGVFLLGDIWNITGQNPKQLDLRVPSANRGRNQTVSTHPLPT